jgi:hypothetical protein
MLLNMPRPYVRGLLESMWEVGWQNVSPVLGDSVDVELAAEWPGDAGVFTKHCKDSGFLNEDCGVFTIHDYWDHAPDYVTKRYARKQATEKARREKHYIMEDGGQRRTLSAVSQTTAACPVLSCPDPPCPDPKEEESTSAVADPPALTPEQLLAMWNDHAILATLPSCRKLSPTRMRTTKARITENPDPEYWVDVLQRISRSSFCRGQIPGRGWRATFDWLIRPETGTKVLEGAYDDTAARASPRNSRTQGNAEALKRFIEGGKEMVQT